MQYAIDVTIVWGIFYTLYFVFLRQVTFFGANRIYMVSALFVGLMLPLIPTITPVALSEPTGFGDQIIMPLNDGLESLYLLATPVPESPFDWHQYVTWIYLVGAFIFSCRFLAGLSKIYWSYREGKKVDQAGYTIIRSKTPHPPFSFFRWLFLGSDLTLSDPQTNQIIRHEQCHIYQKHSLDVLFIELLVVFFWWSPLIYLYRKSIRAIHEYLADEYVLTTTSVRQYRRFLASLNYPGLHLELANPFISSQLKNRFKMMLRSKSPQRSLFRFTLALPILLILTMAFRLQDNHGFIVENIPEMITSDTVPEFAKSEVYNAISKEFSSLKLAKDRKEAQHTFSRLHMMRESYLVSYPQFNGQITQMYADIQKTFSTFMEKSVELPIIGDDGIYKRVDEMPTFKGCDPTLSLKERKSCGDKKLLQFVYENIKYPEVARTNNVEGTVVVRFVIDELGKVQNAQVIRDIGADCGEAALAVVNMMEGKWLPGRQDGTVVPVQFILPVKFKLTQGKSARLYVVDDKVVEVDKVNAATGNYQNIQSIAYLDAKRAVPLYGEDAKAGAVIITTQPNANRTQTLALENFKVYPVPNTGQFQVDFQGEAVPLTFSVRNIKGGSLFEKTYKDFDGHFSEEVRLPSTPSGVVMIYIQQRQSTFTYPVIIQ